MKVLLFESTGPPLSKAVFSKIEPAAPAAEGRSLRGHPEHDGTIAPAAAGGSAAFTPELSIEALRAMKEQYGDKIWGRYGFADAFNADGLWRSPDAVGIDQGAILLAVENARSGVVLKNFMDSENVRRAFSRAGLSKAN